MTVQLARKRPSPDRAVRQFTRLPGSSGSLNYYDYLPAETWRPPVNLYESDASYFVCVDLAGMDRQAIDVTLKQNVLVIAGTRNHPRPTDAGGELSIHLMEIDQGPFCRTVEIPSEVNLAAIRASYTQTGYLWIELPKRKA